MNDIQFNQELWKKLTPREIDILQAASDDLSCKMTAEKLGTTEKTVQVHRHNILKKLQVGSITRAVVEALQGGVISYRQTLS